MERELKEKGLKFWVEAASAAEDRVAWKQRGDSPVDSPVGKRNDDDDSKSHTQYSKTMTTPSNYV